MTYDVRITPRASDDLEAAARWWFNNRSADQAFRWYQGFLDQLESLDEMPERCPLARENPRVPFDLRELHYGLGSHPTHRAVFRILGTTVEVLTVRHLARDDIPPDDLQV